MDTAYFAENWKLKNNKNSYCLCVGYCSFALIDCSWEALVVKKKKKRPETKDASAQSKRILNHFFIGKLHTPSESWFQNLTLHLELISEGGSNWTRAHWQVPNNLSFIVMATIYPGTTSSKSSQVKINKKHSLPF